MQKTKIDWCDYTWNPVTGCLHKCEYCYARKIASRFGKFCKIDQVNIKTVGSGQHTCVEVEYKQETPYPEMFTPTLHKYRLGEPAQKTKPQTRNWHQRMVRGISLYGGTSTSSVGKPQLHMDEP